MILDLKLIAAIIASAISLLVAILTIFNSRRLKLLEHEFAERIADKNARREYEYSAKLRLYEQFEPLFFSFLNAAENSITLIDDFLFMLDSPHQEGTRPLGNYLKRWTMYALIAPLAHFDILRRRLTLVDIQLSNSLQMRFALMECIYDTYTLDRTMSECAKIDYTPYVDGWKELRETNPIRYRRQGFARGRLDNTLWHLIVDENGYQRVINFGEFEREVSNVESDDFSSPMGGLHDLFLNFDIVNRPILWRLMRVQIILYRLLVISAKIELNESNVIGLLDKIMDESCTQQVAEFDSARSIDESVEQFINMVVKPKLVD